MMEFWILRTESRKKSLLRESWLLIIKTQGWKLGSLILSLKWLSMLQTCSKLVLVLSGLLNPDCSSTMKKKVFRGCSDYVIRKNHVTRPIFWDFRITKSGKIRNSFFHPLTKENTIPDYKTRKLQGHFWKKKIGPARKAIEWEFDFTRGLIPNLNSNLVVLIPKVPGADKLENFRPIALVKFQYKIISNILAGCLLWLLKLSLIIKETFFKIAQTHNAYARCFNHNSSSKNLNGVQPN